MSGVDYHMCAGCRRADIDVSMAHEVRGDCPHCGTPTWVEPVRCAMPDCLTLVPPTSELPVCSACGVKIAVAHLHEASRYEAVAAERHAQQQRLNAERRNGTPGLSVVYCVRLDPDRIKIGFTSRLTERMKSMRVLPSNILAIEPGGREVEKVRHEQFRSERIQSRSEEFYPSDRLLLWIESVAAEHGLPEWPPDTKTVTTRRVS
jgi:hypothetical protein